jgi:hypothetical protein
MKYISLLRASGLAVALSLGSVIAAQAENAEPMPVPTFDQPQRHTEANMDSNSFLSLTSDSSSPAAEDQAAATSSDSGLHCNPGPGFDRCEAKSSTHSALN